MDEKKLISVVRPYLISCRSGDWNHALRVVRWVKSLGKNNERLDLLVTAAYIHDIGWTNILPRGKIDFDRMLLYESRANRNTSRLVREVLTQMNFPRKDIITVIRLIKAADKHTSRYADEAIIVDADNLSKLCVAHVKEKYLPQSYAQVIRSWEIEFPKQFKTVKGKALFPRLLCKLKKSIVV